MRPRSRRWLVATVLVLGLVLAFLLFRGGRESPGSDPASAEETYVDATRPLVMDLEPADGAVLRGTHAWIRWRSPIPALGRLRFRTEGEAEFRMIGAVQGEFLLAAITPLESGKTYEYQAENDAAGRVERSVVRRFTAAGGLAFDPSRVEASVKRDYDQSVTLTLRNASDERLPVAAKALAQFEDLPLDIVGPGSVDEPTEVAPGGALSLRLAVTASDATRGTYEVPIEAGGAYGVVVIRIENPELRLALRVVREDPNTLAKEVEIVNEGESLADLSIRIAQPDQDDVLLLPAAGHASLASGSRLHVVASPVLYLEFRELDAQLECTAAGQRLAFPLPFRAPEGLRFLGVRSASEESTRSADRVCTNRPNTCSNLPSGSGNGPEATEPAAPADPAIGEKLLTEAQKYDGKPYGGKGPDSFDCSGLVSQAFKDAGLPDPNVGTGGGCENAWDKLDPVAAGDVKVGDVVFWDLRENDTQNYGEKDGRADHCGLVQKVEGGGVTEVFHSSGKGVHGGPANDYAFVQDGPDPRLTEFVIGYRRAKSTPAPGACSAEGGGCGSAAGGGK